MIALNTQIITLIVSFIYGIFFSFQVNISTKFLYQPNIILRIVFTFLFIFSNVLLYFIILRKVNYAVIHPYALGMLFLGFCVERYFNRIIAKHIKK